MALRTYQLQVQVLITASALNFSVTSALALTSEATDGIRRELDDDLGLTQDATWELQPFNGERLESELGLTQEAKAFGFETVSSELGLTSLATREVFATQSRTELLNLVQTVEYGYAVRNLSVETELALTSELTRTYVEDIEHPLNLSSIAFRAFPVESDLSLTSTVEWGFGLDVESDLDLTQTLELNKLLNQNISHTSVTQAVTYFIESPCNRYAFNRFHGSGGTVPATKRLNYANTFYLQSIDDGTTIQLRNPETDDRQRYAFNRVNRNLLDGSPDVYSDSNWATEQSQLYTIVANKREKLEPLFTFLQENLGRQIIIKDWTGVTWVVIVTNPGDLYTEDGEDYWTLNFDVEGEAFDGEWFLSYLELTDDASRAGSTYNRLGTESGILSQEATYTIA